MPDATPGIPLRSRKLAAVSYLPLMGALVWFAYRNRSDAYVRFHSVQGSVAALYLLAAYGIPVVGPYLSLFCAALCVSGFLHAHSGKSFRIPGVAWLTDMLVS